MKMKKIAVLLVFSLLLAGTEARRWFCGGAFYSPEQTIVISEPPIVLFSVG